MRDLIYPVVPSQFHPLVQKRHPDLRYIQRKIEELFVDQYAVLKPLQDCDEILSDHLLGGGT